jgi:PST family polysaccharide transporter
MANLETAYAAPPVDRVGTLARSGAKWSVFYFVLRQLFGIGATAIIARLLVPDDFGLLAMVATLTMFLALWTDMGLSWATVQHPELQGQQVHSLFWTGGLLGLATWAACIIAAPLAAKFYGRAELAPICMVMGAGLLCQGLYTQPGALLKRRLQQKEYAFSQAASNVAANVVCIVMAVLGLGYWALVGQALALPLFLLMLTLWYSAYRPGWPKISPGTLSMLRFGGYVGAFNLINFFQIYLDSILIGRFCGADELGYYSRAMFLRTLPAMYASVVVTDVMVSALSALAHDKDRMAAAYRKALRLIAFVGCLLGVLLGITASESVRLIYGPAWAPVVPILVVLSFPATVLPVYQTMSWLFIAVGKSRQMFFLTLGLTPIVAAAYCIGIRWGGVGIAAAAACLFTVPFPLIALYCAHRAAGIKLRDTLIPLLPILGCGALAALAGLGAGQLCHQANAHWLVTFAVKLFAGGVTYFLAALAWVKPMPIPVMEYAASFFRQIPHLNISKKKS